MPAYDYRCSQCGDFEIIQSMNEEALTECPECGNPVRRLISKPAVIFNGSGFYCTDYSGNNKGEKKGSSKDKSA